MITQPIDPALLAERITEARKLGPVIAVIRCPSCLEQEWCLIHDCHWGDCDCPSFLDLIDPPDGDDEDEEDADGVEPTAPDA